MTWLPGFLLTAVLGPLAAPCGQPSEITSRLEQWLDRYARRLPEMELFQDSHKEALFEAAAMEPRENSGLQRFVEAYLAHMAVRPEQAIESHPADLIAAIRSPEVIRESARAELFTRYADMLELFELASQDGASESIRLLLEIASFDCGRSMSPKEWRHEQPFRPHLVRREARLALLRVPGTRGMETLLAALSSISPEQAKPVRPETQEVAASLLEVIVRREKLAGYRQFQLLETCFSLLEHGRNERLRFNCGLVLAALLESAPGRTLGKGKLARLLQIATEEQPVAVQVAALRVLAHIPEEAVIRRLAERLGSEARLPDRLVDELLDTLSRIAPDIVLDRGNRGAWLEWYLREKDTDQFRRWIELRAGGKTIEEERPIAERYDPLPRFYGVPALGKRIVFVIDVSGSMLEPLEPFGAVSKISMARRELVATIRALPQETRINLVKFNPVVRVWSEEFVQATQGNKLRAEKFFHGQEGSGGTNLFGGLQQALGVAGTGRRLEGESRSLPDQIILLSDGRPTVGLLTNAEDIVEEVSDMARDLGLRIDTVAFGLDADQDFLRNLAGRNGGMLSVILSDD
ncbi:MAG: VWA domain-containing protein [Planctomycetota bacterium]